MEDASPEQSDDSVSCKSLRRSSSSGSKRHSVESAGDEPEATSSHVRSPRRPHRVGIDWSVGNRLEAKDFLNKWYSAKIISVDDGDMTVLIHFDGWNHRYDEWVKMDSERLRPISKQFDRLRKERGQHKSVYKVGEYVFARWTDGRMYPAKIMAVNADGLYNIMFYDGPRKTVKPELLHVMSAQDQKQYNKTGMLIEQRRQQTTSMQLETHTQSVVGQSVDESEGRLARRRHSSFVSQSPDVEQTAIRRRKVVSVDGDPQTMNWQLDRNSISTHDENSSLPVTPVPQERRLHKLSNLSPPVSAKRRRRTAASDDTPSSCDVPSQSAAAVGPVVNDTSTQMPVTGDNIEQQCSSSSVGGDTCQIQDNTTPAETRCSLPVTDIDTKHSTHTVVDSSSLIIPVTVDLVSCPLVPNERSVFTGSTKSTVRRSMISSSRRRSVMTYLATNAKMSAENTATDEQLQCASCGKSFRNGTLLDYHMKYFHTVKGTVVSATVRRRTSLPSRLAKASSLVAGRVRASSTGALLGVSADNQDSQQTTVEHQPETTHTLSCTDTSVEKSLSSSSGGAAMKVDRKVVNCVCAQNEDMTQLIQCSICLCWQHLRCVEPAPMRKYICSFCVNPPGVRESARYSYDQDWLHAGRMCEFSCVEPEANSAAKAKIMKATHDLVADVDNVMRVIDAVSRKIFVVQQQCQPDNVLNSEPDRKEQKQDSCSVDIGVVESASAGTTVESNGADGQHLPCVVPEIANTNSSIEGNFDTKTCVDERLTSSADSNGAVHCELNTDSTEQNASLIDHQKLSTQPDHESSNNTLDSSDSATLSDVSHGEVNMTNGAQQHDHTLLEPVIEQNYSVENDTIFLRQISIMQDDIDQRLSLIEEQVNALENGEGNGDPLRDMARVKKTTRQLLNDLRKVSQLSKLNKSKLCY